MALDADPNLAVKVRTALQDLAAQGLVEFQRNRGARVRDVTLGEAIEITEVRMLLEGHEGDVHGFRPCVGLIVDGD